MKNGIIRRKFAFASTAIALFAVTAAGCNDRSPMLQYQQDGARHRGWALTPAGVSVVDLRSGRTLTEIRLPGWHWAGAPYGCTPALALGPKGEALVSSDVMPTLWRIDPDKLTVSRHDLALDANPDKDVGFASLTYAAEQGAFVAVACSGGSLWRVEPQLLGARRI